MLNNNSPKTPHLSSALPKISQSTKAVIFCANEANIDKIALWILDTRKRIFLLCGAVGSGKTTLIQAVISCMQNTKKSSKKSRSNILQASSPTFGVRNEYGKVGEYGEVFHYDLYNVGLNEVLELGLLEWLSEAGWHFLEWGEEVLPILQDSGFECVTIEISEESLGENLAQDYLAQQVRANHNSLDFNAKRFYKISL